MNYTQTPTPQQAISNMIAALESGEFSIIINDDVKHGPRDVTQENIQNLKNVLAAQNKEPIK